MKQIKTKIDWCHFFLLFVYSIGLEKQFVRICLSKVNQFYSYRAISFRKSFVSCMEWCRRWRIHLQAYRLHIANHSKCSPESNVNQCNRVQKCFDWMSSLRCSSSKGFTFLAFLHTLNKRWYCYQLTVEIVKIPSRVGQFSPHSGHVQYNATVSW